MLANAEFLLSSAVLKNMDLHSSALKKYKNNQPKPLGSRDQPVTTLACHVILVPPYALFCCKLKILEKISFYLMTRQFRLEKSWRSDRKSCRGAVPPSSPSPAEIKGVTWGCRLPSALPGISITTGRLSTQTLRSALKPACREDFFLRQDSEDN